MLECFFKLDVPFWAWLKSGLQFLSDESSGKQLYYQLLLF